MEKAELNFMFFVTIDFGAYSVYFQTRFGTTVVRSVGNPGANK